MTENKETKPTIKRETIAYNALTNRSFFGLLDSCLEVAAESGHIEEHMALQCIKVLDDDLTVFKGIIHKETTHSDRMELDAIRDDDFNYIKTLLQTNAIMRKKERKFAANELLKAFDTFDINLGDLKMIEESSELDGLLNMWDKVENKVHIETIGLTADVAKLKASHLAFKEGSKEHLNKDAKQSPKPRVIRRRLQQSFAMWLDVLEGLANLNNDALCYQLLSKINGHIKDEKAYLKAKNTRKEEVEA